MRAWISYPGLTRQEFGNTASIAWRRSPAIHLIHSTEGGGYPSAATYRDGRSAPHFTVDMRARTARQHYPLTEGAWALQAPAGVATNSGGAIQYELIGTCSRMPGIYDVTKATDGELAYLAGLLQAVSAETGIPLTSSVPFVRYPASYGATGTRMTAAEWATYRGIAGHQHVPGNSHGDPGDFPIQRLLALMSNPTPDPEDDDMTPDQAAALNEIQRLARLIVLAPTGAASPATAAEQHYVNWARALGSPVPVEIGAEALAAAIPDELAQQVVERLGERLKPSGD